MKKERGLHLTTLTRGKFYLCQLDTTGFSINIYQANGVVTRSRACPFALLFPTDTLTSTRPGGARIYYR